MGNLLNAGGGGSDNQNIKLVQTLLHKNGLSNYANEYSANQQPQQHKSQDIQCCDLVVDPFSLLAALGAIAGLSLFLRQAVINNNIGPAPMGMPAFIPDGNGDRPLTPPPDDVTERTNSSSLNLGLLHLASTLTNSTSPLVSDTNVTSKPIIVHLSKRLKSVNNRNVNIFKHGFKFHNLYPPS